MACRPLCRLPFIAWNVRFRVIHSSFFGFRHSSIPFGWAISRHSFQKWTLNPATLYSWALAEDPVMRFTHDCCSQNVTKVYAKQLETNLPSPCDWLFQYGSGNVFNEYRCQHYFFHDFLDQSGTSFLCFNRNLSVILLLQLFYFRVPLNRIYLRMHQLNIGPSVTYS